MARPRGGRPGRQKLGAAATAGQAQRRQEQGVLPAPSARCLVHLGQRPGEGTLAQRGDLRSDHVPVDGMGKPHFDAAAVPAAGDQAPALKRRDGRGVGQLVQPGLAERLAQGQQLQDGPLGVGKVA